MFSASSSDGASCPDSPSQYPQKAPNQRNGSNVYEDVGDVQKPVERKMNFSAESTSDDIRMSSITSPMTSPTSLASHDPFNTSSS